MMTKMRRDVPFDSKGNGLLLFLPKIFLFGFLFTDSFPFLFLVLPASLQRSSSETALEQT
jgi:hypothetical protein